MAHMLPKCSIQIFLLLFFAEELRRFLGQKISPDFFHFCQHNFMEREYQWDRFGRLIKSRSTGYFFSPLFLFTFFYPLHLSLNILSTQAFPSQPVFPLSHSFLPLPVLYSRMRPSAICSAERSYFIIWLEVSAFT